MDKSRFSLLLLEPGEIYFEDFSVELRGGAKDERQMGRLKLCSKSLVFEPIDAMQPLLKMYLQFCDDIKNKHGYLSVKCNSWVEISEGNVIAPHKFQRTLREFLFSLHYIPIDDCLSQILQLQRASTLSLPDHNSMVAAIAFSRKSRLKFDRSWLQNMYEAIILESDASKVSPLVVNPGRVVLSSTTIYFQPFNNADSYPVLKLKISDITSITRRRFLQRQVGLELFCDGASVKHLYLVFESVECRKKFCSALDQQPTLQLRQHEPEIMTLKWQNHAISNYDYLLYVNSLADRSFNDLTQYPVFPWVISDYQSDFLDMNDPKVFRDLSKPVGALNPDRLRKLKERRDDMGEPRFLYGSHYSTPAFVLFYLIRKHPQYMLCLQNGRFDHPDRIFHCMADVWRNVLENMADFKELIPEFYDTSFNGDFLLHLGGAELGTRHDGTTIRDVILPPWCDSAADFVHKLRDALESDYVSRSLSDWIDLVFGWKQRGRPAEDYDNVFYPLCYEGAVDLDSVTDWSERHALEVQIMEFGQIPKQVFSVPHPKRLRLDPTLMIPNKDVSTLSSLTITELGRHKEAVTGIASYDDTIVSVGRDSVLKEYSISDAKVVRSVHLDTAGISSCVLLPDADTLILGTFDNRILVYKLECSTILDEIRVHEDAISCLCWNSTSSTLLSGSWDGSMRIWREAFSLGKLGRLITTATSVIDRETKITCASISSDGEFVTCGTDAGEVAVFSMHSTATLLELDIHRSHVTAVSILGTRLVSCSKDGFHVHDIPSGLHIYSGCQQTHITSLAWFGELLLLGTACGYIQCWDFNKVIMLETISAQHRPVSCLYSAGFVISAEDKIVLLRR